jgi:poly(3-hydroxybutyrate) depolymerase
MYEPTGRQLPHLAFLWPALAAASASEIAGSIAKQFIGLTVTAEDDTAAREPDWATPNTVALDLKTVRLRDFSTAREGVATLLCAPYALHGAGIVDLAPGHSLVAALREAGLGRLFVTHWRSADVDMRFLSIDDYLADLNVLVDQLGGTIDLIGLCQGGWLSLLYAARFPAKVRKLVLAGAPIDIAAAPSGLSALTDASPLTLFQELVMLGDGRVLGHAVQRFWGPETLEDDEIHQLLQTCEAIDSSTFARLVEQFRAWYAWTVDLPGTYYLEVIDKLYKRNELARGHFVALGQRIDLATVRTPLFLLAARDDELIAPAQLFATENLVGTPAQEIHKEMVGGHHLGLFVGQKTLTETWQRIVHWLSEPERPAISTSRH